MDEFVACIIDTDYNNSKDITVYGIYPTEQIAMNELIKIIIVKRIGFQHFNHTKEYILKNNEEYNSIYLEKIENEEDFISALTKRITDEESLEKWCDILNADYYNGCREEVGLFQ